MTVLVPFANDLIQTLLLLLIAPFVTDGLSILSDFFAGRPVGRIGTRWRELRRGWMHPRLIPLWAWCALAPAVFVLAALPLASAHSILTVFSEPLLVGILLLLARVPLWCHALQLPEGSPGAQRGRRIIRDDTANATLLLPLLALIGVLLSVGLPGVGDLASLARDIRIQPAPALTGSLIFIAIAILGLLQHAWLCASRTEELFPDTEGQLRAILRYSHDAGTLGWLLLLADLAWPGALAVETTSWRETALSMFIAFPLRLVTIMTLAAFWRAFGPPSAIRIALALSGAAILLVLAGRFAT